MPSFLNKERLKFYLAICVISLLFFPIYQLQALSNEFDWYKDFVLGNVFVALIVVWGGRYTVGLGIVVAFQRVFEIIAVNIWGVFFKGITVMVIKHIENNTLEEFIAYTSVLYKEVIMGSLFLLLYLAIYVYAGIVAVKYLENKRKNKPFWKNALRLILAILILFYAGTNKVKTDVFFFERDNINRIELYQSENTMPYLSKPSNKKIDLYFIVGESVSKSQMSLYGYNRETTPYLSSLSWDTLTKYKDPISAAEHTSASLQIMFSRITKLDEKTFFLSPNLIEELNHSNYRTVWITYRAMNKDLIYPAITDSATELYNSHRSSNDRKMLPLLKKSYKKDTPSVYFVHMNGSHPGYGRGLSNSERRYSKIEVDDFKQETLNKYDDTILELDDFLKQVHSIAEQNAKKSKRPYSIIYLSDHGQNLFADGSDWYGHSSSYEAQPNGMEVPFLIFNKHNLPCYRSLPSEDTDKLKLGKIFDMTLNSLCLKDKIE